ncbi:alkaline phosphatase isoform X1 [Cydia pomonella]|uniref:alkaline phosphatase isoform X1 n=1 Tax=Cydia pomonella TaxID=82600 RepID=UPI002ADDDD78|nr:alkaline phosphatase isoform X1 [Cydia pomonella]
MRVLILFLFVFGARSLRTDQKYWRDLAHAELEEALNVKRNENRAKNVILFIGDGMGPNTITATRIYKGGEGYRMAFEEFPHVGLLKTYSANKMVPDSASTATAMFTGTKVNQRTIGVDATVAADDCPKSLDPEAQLKSLAAVALEAGKSAGFVTTMRVTHATPAPLYAHTANRHWECESVIPQESRACKDIARQLVEDWPGRDLHVIMGGGRQMLVSNSSALEGDPINLWGCYSTDGRDLIRDWKMDKAQRELKYSMVQNNSELSGVNFDDTDYLMGIFANGHMAYEFERNHGPEGMPSISEMVEAAIKVLRRNPNGYFLMVEGGNIDMAHHRGRAKTAIDEAAALEDAVRVAASMTDEADTLLVVTADHTHTLSINGYPLRGSNIFGHSEVSPYDHKSYTTLSYGTGGPGALHYEVEDQHAVRREPGNSDDFMYEQIAGIILDENSHGGGDTTIYARGPKAHLFHTVHEQHYVFHALCRAARLGAHAADAAARVALALTVLLLASVVHLLC